MKKIIILLIILIVLFLLWMLWGWLSVRGIEQPRYALVTRNGIYEIRDYDPLILATATISGTRDEATNEGFRIIADYIFGNNVVREPIAMTTPVTSKNSEPIAMTSPVTSKEEEKNNLYTIAFVMPSKYTMETLPKPLNSAVKIEEMAKKTYAVLTFSGYVWDKKVESKKRELLTALEKDGVKTADSYILSQYNPPWTPWFMRRNEIWMELKDLKS